MAFPVAMIAGAIPLIGGLIKKKRYVLWLWDGSAWQAVTEGTSKTVKNSDKEYKKNGYTTVITKAGVTPAPLQNAKSDSTTDLTWWLVAAGGAIVYLFFIRKRKR